MCVHGLLQLGTSQPKSQSFQSLGSPRDAVLKLEAKNVLSGHTRTSFALVSASGLLEGSVVVVNMD